MRDFQYWDKQFKQGNMSSFNDDPHGLLWLKIKSIVRKDLIARFAKHADLAIGQLTLSGAFLTLFQELSADITASQEGLDGFIRSVSTEQVAATDTERLVSELYKLRHFDWGGDYQNSLDKFLVSRYVKTDDPSFERLLSKFDTEINPAVQGYVLSSWYNYWSSVLIENIFKSHSAVLPTVGKVKSVDFFLHGIPFDLKVTYFPSEYLAIQRKARGYPVERTFLKQQARSLGITYDKNATPDTIEYTIREKMRDRSDAMSKSALATIREQNISVLSDAMSNPLPLSKWLYENQGEMRFGSENRIYLILVDMDDFESSWRLKRNVDLLRPTIVGFLDSLSVEALRNKKVEFVFKGKAGTFSALAEVVFVVAGGEGFNRGR